MSKLSTLKENRDKAVAELRKLSDANVKALTDENRNLTDDEAANQAAAETRVAQFDAAIKTAEADRARKDAEKEARNAKIGTGELRVKHEALTYSEANPDNSFYGDLMAATRNVPATRGAIERLERHQHEVEVLADGPQGTHEARSARKIMVDVRRGKAKPERRDMSTSGASLGDWAPPIYALNDFASWRTFGRSFIGQLKTVPLPSTGMTIYIPRVTTPTQAVNQTANGGENTVFTNRDMTGSYEDGAIQTIGDNAFVSQQLLDRFGPADYAADQMILQDQAAQINLNLDLYGVGQILSLVDSTNNYIAYNDSAFNAYAFLQKVRSAEIALETTDGVVTSASHVFTTPSVSGSILAALDANNRPYVVPQAVAYNPLAVGDEISGPFGYTGYSFAGAPLFKDQNIWTSWNANSGATPGESNDHPTIVGDLVRGAEWAEGAPVVRVLPQPYATQLTVVIQSYVYCALTPRYPGMWYVVSGTGTNQDYLL